VTRGFRASATRIQAIVRYARRRPASGPAFLRAMLDPPAEGRSELTAEERRDAMRTDAMLRRLGVRCLWRAAIVTDRLRASGVAARIGLTISARDPRRAHAEPEVGGEPLRPYGEDSVPLQ
jgi:hypothetical protein